MNSENSQRLIKKYSYMFKEMERSKKKFIENENIREQLLNVKDEITKKSLLEQYEKVGSYYPIAFGFECDDGWVDLLDELMEKLKEFDKLKSINIHQIKEKYGGLRFYTNYSYNEELYNIIKEFEEKSYTICEICGKEAVICKSGNWYKTVCENHRDLETWAGIKQHYIPV